MKAKDDDIYYIPYDEQGKFLGKKTKKLMKIDFSVGSKIKVVHPDSCMFGIIGEITRKCEDNYQISLKQPNKIARHYALGFWMIESAINGNLDRFSFSNENPQFFDKK